MTLEADLKDLPRFQFLDAEFERLSRQAAEPRPPRRWVIRVALAGAALALVVAVVAALVDGSSKSGLGPSEAQAALHRLADTAASDQDLIAGPGQYLYQRALTDSIPGEVFREGDGAIVSTGEPVSATSERWLSTDGRGSFVVSSNGKRSEEGSFGIEGVVGGPDTDNFGGSLKLTYEQLLDLPRDPTLLFERVKELERREGGGLVGAFASLLETPVPADLQSALLDAAALLPGASLEEGVETPNGDTLSAVSYDQAPLGATYELLFDPESDTYRGHALVLADGQRFFGSLILERGVVSSDGEVPGGQR